MKYLFTFTQHGMPPEIGAKWGTECFNTRLYIVVIYIFRFYALYPTANKRLCFYRIAK